MSKAPRTLVVTILIVLTFVVVMNMLGQNGLGGKQTVRQDYKMGEFKIAVQNKEVLDADWSGAQISGKLANKKEYTVNAFAADSSSGQKLQELFDDNKVKYTISQPSFAQSGLILLLSSIGGPLLFLALLYFFFIKPAQSGGNQAMNFGRSKAKRAGENTPKVSFDDVAGIDEAKQELFEVVDFLKNTKKYVALGAKIPKGVLLTGPPGVGKTHLARAIAGEAGVPFFHISGSDFVEMFVGVGAARVRDLFETAKAHRPCLIFIDEIDAVGRQRGAGMGGGHDEREQTLNQLLVEMDGFETNSGVIMVAATNRPDVLDPALLRPGRFDRQVVVDAPDAKGREAILKIHGKGKPFDTAVNYATIAKRTPGFTGADLANALNEAALLTARRNGTKIGVLEVEEALDRVMVGPARKSRVMIDKERKLTAYHEAGHAIVGELLAHCDPIHKVTILPRGHALGITWSLPDTDKMSESKSELLDDIKMSLGGLVAEEVVFGERWTGATSDLQRVTRIARAMVTQFGMSEKLGTLAIGRRSGNPFLGRDYQEDRNYSEDVARQIDEEVKRIVDACHAHATQILSDNRLLLDKLVDGLMERETLDREEFMAIMNGEEMPALPVEPEAIAEPPVISTESDNSTRITPPRLEPGPA
ncbi:MAG: ATP-dependent zinc metalloprotease FtsH [Armatimonadetes bacterium]|nr:ATP-dependent zinc metalloprotease FtsH [Armatimonadota bacterium]